MMISLGQNHLKIQYFINQIDLIDIQRKKISRKYNINMNAKKK